MHPVDPVVAGQDRDSADRRLEAPALLHLVGVVVRPSGRPIGRLWCRCLAVTVPGWHRARWKRARRRPTRAGPRCRRATRRPCRPAYFGRRFLTVSLREAPSYSRRPRTAIFTMRVTTAGTGIDPR